MDAFGAPDRLGQADNWVLYPIIIKKGRSISNAIAGQSKKPGTPNPSIQFTVPSKLKILLYPDNKKTEEIKTLPKKSKKFAITY